MMYNSTFFKKPSLIKLYFGLLLITICGLYSCGKEAVDTNTYGVIAVVNASPTVSTYDVYLGGSKINAAALPLGGAVSFLQKVTGNYEVKFTVAGRTDNVYTKSISIGQDSWQTFYLMGTAGSLDGVLISDNHFDISTTQAFIRFVNASPDAPALDLYIQGGASVIQNKAYKTGSPFQNIPTGTYTFDIKQTSNGVVKTSTESVTLGASGYYTVLVRGMNTPAANGTELPLSAKVMVSQ
jgi:hypothetical protein